MNGCHVLLGVFMAAIARIACIVRRMADFAIRVFTLVPVIERKRVLDESSGTPTCGSMTGGAISTKLTTMDLRISVTRNAIGRRATITIIDVTFRTRDGGMLAIERKHSRMIETF